MQNKRFKNRRKRRKKSTKKLAKEWLTLSEIKAILDLPDLKLRDEVIVWLLYGGALRVSEMCNLRREDVDFENNYLIIRQSKTSDTPQLVPVPNKILKKINQLMNEEKTPPAGYIFKGHDGKPLTRQHVYRIVNELAQRAGIQKKLGTHSFRRSRATHLLDAGLPLEKVSKFLRHQQLSSTMSYLKISVEDLKKEVNKVDPIENGMI